MDHVPHDIGEQFGLLFDADDGFTLLKKEALSARLKHYSSLHFIAWQALLRVFPSLQEETANGKSYGCGAWKFWPQESGVIRGEYEALKNELIVNPYTKQSDLHDATDDNPLSTGESSTWAKYFANSELRQDILRDVSRTYPEIEFFRDSAIQETMTTILFIYAKTHPQVSYKQGMHEILAPLILMLHRARVEKRPDTPSSDQTPNQKSNEPDSDEGTPLTGQGSENGVPNLRTETETESKPPATTRTEAELEKYRDTIKTLDDPKYLEHDAYSLFSKIMEYLGPFYIQSPKPTGTPVAGQSSKDSIKDGLSDSSTNGESGDATVSTSAILRKCKLIQDVLLKKHDEALSLHLTDVGLEPQLFLMRWIRILFGREFHLEDTLVVWDAIFSYDDKFGLVDPMAVAMLIFIRSQLLGRDFADCIKRLQKYPPVEDVSILIEHAIALTKPRPAGVPPGPLPFGNGSLPAASNARPSPNPFSSVTLASAPVNHVSSQFERPATKPVVYVSPAYNAQLQSQVQGQTNAPSHISSITTSKAPVKKSATASDALKGATLLHTPPRPLTAVQPPAPQASHTNSQHQQSAPSNHYHSSKSQRETPMVTVPKEQWEDLQNKLVELQHNQTKFGDKLNGFITSIQAKMSDSTIVSSMSTEVSDLLLLTIAGLKRVRDVANGLLSDEDIDFPDPSTQKPKHLANTTASSPSKPIHQMSSGIPPHTVNSNNSSSNTSISSTETPAVSIYASSIMNLPPADSDWSTSPASVLGHLNSYSPPHSESQPTPSHTPPIIAKSSSTPTKSNITASIVIPPSSEASHAVVSGIFD